MAVVHEVSDGPGLLKRLLTTDFCPWANRFVYWLKEPIGWFVLATITSVLIGLYFNPIGWSLAAALTAIIVVGMVWPLIAVQVCSVELHPEQDVVHEDDCCRMIVSVSNRIPLPLWGLTVEGYLDRTGDSSTTDMPSHESLPTAGLASVPPLCRADYGIEIRPELRGNYPCAPPQLACAFPFGIWTARRNVSDHSLLTVWPKTYVMQRAASFRDRVRADTGNGNRGGREGDFIGVREYRRGDSAKDVNWVASARTDALIVTERSAAQTAHVEIALDTATGDGGRDELSRRIRIAASIIRSLHSCGVPFRVRLGDKLLRVANGLNGYRQTMDALASIPLEGHGSRCSRRQKRGAWISITGCEDGTDVTCCNPSGVRRAGNVVRTVSFSMTEDLDQAMVRFWKEAGHADVAA